MSSGPQRARAWHVRKLSAGDEAGKLVVAGSCEPRRMWSEFVHHAKCDQSPLMDFSRMSVKG